MINGSKGLLELYEGIAPESKYVIIFSIVFLVKRLLLSLSIVVASKYLTRIGQLMACFSILLACLIVNTVFVRFKGKFLTIIHIVTEV
jgi:hypothetical protein